MNPRPTANRHAKQQQEPFSLEKQAPFKLPSSQAANFSLAKATVHAYFLHGPRSLAPSSTIPASCWTGVSSEPPQHPQRRALGTSHSFVTNCFPLHPANTLQSAHSSRFCGRPAAALGLLGSLLSPAIPFSAAHTVKLPVAHTCSLSTSLASLCFGAKDQSPCCRCKVKIWSDSCFCGPLSCPLYSGFPQPLGFASFHIRTQVLPSAS